MPAIDARHKYVSLTTFRKDGTAVATPVWFASDDDDLLVWTEARAGKVKRIRRSGNVTIAPCDFRGRVRGDAVAAIATICDDAGSAHIRELIKRKYGVMGWFTITMSTWRRGRTGTLGLRISVPATEQPPAAP